MKTVRSLAAMILRQMGLHGYLERVRARVRARAVSGEPANHAVFSRARWNRIDDVNRMLDDGCDINMCDANGNTLLHIACQNGHDALVKLLVVLNADPNCQNTTGQTARLRAAPCGPCARLLPPNCGQTAQLTPRAPCRRL